MKLVLTVLAVAACAACYRGPEDIPSEKVAPLITHQPAATEACADTLYVRLLAIPVDSLSPRLYEQFRIRDAACVASRVPARQP
jgi:hypothetical protein